MTIGLNAFQMHQALNLHFSDKSDYDCFKYNFKTRVTPEKLSSSPFKWQYINIEKKSTNLLLTMFMVYKQFDFGYVPSKTLVFNSKKYFDLTPESVLDKTIANDLKWLNVEYNGSASIFEQDDSDLYPNLYNDYEGGKIDLITLLSIDMFIKSFINKDRSRDIITWPKFVSRMDKVSPFIEQFFIKQDIEDMFVKTYLDY